MKELKALPIGVSSFEKISKDGDLYVDKTKQLYEIVRSEGGRMYFLSRPRRFGKSLLCDTIKQLFLGKRELFKGLWIEDKWDFEKKIHPVIHISMREKDLSLQFKDQVKNILSSIVESGEVLGIELEEKEDPQSAFHELIRKSSNKYGKKPVILIDEYDKPIASIFRKWFKVRRYGV